MNLGLLLIIVLIVLAIGGLPQWGYHSFGYYPGGGIGLVLLIVLVLIVVGRL